MKRAFPAGLLIVAIVVGWIQAGCAGKNLFGKTGETKRTGLQTQGRSAQTPAVGDSGTSDCRDRPDAVYTIDGEKIALVCGASEKTIPGSSAKIVTRYFGNEVRGDLNRDGREDIAFVLTQEKGGSGTFYYLAAALSTSDGYRGTRALLLGDRIVPQTTIRDVNRPDVIVVSYAEREAGEPMAVKPSRMVSRAARVMNGELIEIALDFPREADSNGMTLEMKTWIWVSTAYADGRRVEPKTTGSFGLTFRPGGRVSVRTDCNSMVGPYSAKEGKFILGNLAATKMFCEGSQESDFSRMLGEVSRFFFNSRGELIMEFQHDSGLMIFKSQPIP